ncbi:DUF3987 domain-containing protein [Shewanella khirikhana]|uniref:DUF3987 domain-containing protein n=1 Tax=Shewanella khirikhana TaxID=1965282 RepID=UPI0030CC40E7
MFQNIRNLLAKPSTPISPVGRELAVSNDDNLHTDTWPTPQSFSPELTPVIPFTSDLLPEPLGRYVLSYAQRLDLAPVEYAAISVLTTACALIGNSVNIQPKQFDTSWTVPAVLWAIAIGSPSMMKTPSLNCGMSLIDHVQNSVINQQNEQLKNAATVESTIRNLHQKSLEKRVQQALSADETDLARKILADAIPSNLPQKAGERRVSITDFTLAALQRCLADNPNGLLLFRDELSGLLAALSKPQGDEMRTFLLQAFDASGSYQVDRVKFGTYTVNKPNLSILGGLQPCMLRKVLNERSSNFINDGFFERLQIAVMPDFSGEYVDIAPDEKLNQEVKNLYEKLTNLALLDKPITLTFEPAAQNIWTEWATALKQRQKNASELEQAVLGKQSSLCAKIAMVLHVLKSAATHRTDESFVPTDIVELTTLEQAIRWIELLHSHNTRIQQYFLNEGAASDAELLLQKLAVFTEPFALRDIHRRGWGKLSKPGICQEAIERLISMGHIVETIQKGPSGRTSKKYRLNPHSSN